MNTGTLFVIDVLFLLIGIAFGWAMRYVYDEVLDALYVEPHPYQHIFETNPHPELYDKEGAVYKGDYITASFSDDPWAYEYGNGGEEIGESFYTDSED